ncbi:MAG TPA: branched-chain amino acid ABC transporter permease [Acidimicrobiales bacterium]|nr:branched-chain amino acid ABC transporter permease [Acidimicrobiales bacterium]
MSLFLSLLVNGLTLGGVYALVALGYSMVYGVLQLLNFANGDLYMVGAFVGFGVLQLAGGPGAIGIPVPLLVVCMVLAAMAVSGILGGAMERVAYRRLRNAPRIAPLISALGVSFFLENAALLIAGGDYYSYDTTSWISPSSGLSAGPLSISSVQLLVIVSSLALMAVLHVLVQKTRIGRAMRAIAYDRDAAAMMGVDVDRVIMLVFVLGGAVAGAAGVISAIVFPQVWYFMGFDTGLQAFTAAVVGGIGSVSGSLLGGLTIGLASSFTAGYLSSTYSELIVFGILIVFVLLRPRGILGASLVRKL